MTEIDLDDVDLGFVVNLQILKEVMKDLSVEGRNWWIASDPQDAGERGYISIGFGDAHCNNLSNTVYFQIPVIHSVAPRYQRPRLILLFDSAYVKPEVPGFYAENGVYRQDDLEDFQCFFRPIKKALISRMQMEY